MLEQLEARVAAAAERRVRARIAALAERMREVLPAGLTCEAMPDGVAIEGRDAGRRIALDPALRAADLR